MGPLLIAAFLGPPSSCCKGVFFCEGNDGRMKGGDDDLLSFQSRMIAWKPESGSNPLADMKSWLVYQDPSIVLYEHLQFHGEFHSDHDSSDSEDWEVVDPSSDTRMPTTDTSVSVLQQSVEDPDDECYIVFSSGRRHMRAFPLHWKKRQANLSDHLHRIE